MTLTHSLTHHSIYAISMAQSFCYSFPVNLGRWPFSAVSYPYHIRYCHNFKCAPTTTIVWNLSKFNLVVTEMGPEPRPNRTERQMKMGCFVKVSKRIYRYLQYIWHAIRSSSYRYLFGPPVCQHRQHCVSKVCHATISFPHFRGGVSARWGWSSCFGNRF